MSNRKHLSRYVREERTKRGWSFHYLAKAMGYRNLNKGANRVTQLEREGICSEDFLRKVSVALELVPEQVEALITKDREEHQREFDEWASKPSPMTIITRHIAGFYTGTRVPENITEPKDAISYASQQAKEHQKMLWLKLDRIHTVKFNESGEQVIQFALSPDFQGTPTMTTKRGRSFLFEVMD